jgi:transcriptional regulator with XRE-family HTH domain
MTQLKDLHRRWSKDESYKAAYDALDEEFQLARALIEARTRAGLSQMQLARRMKTSQSYVARIEGGKVHPSTDALRRFAHATGTRLRITFRPAAARREEGAQRWR